MLETTRTIAEIAQRYKSEKRLRDVYVEGVADVDFLKYIAEIMEWEDVVFYDISSVYITNEMLEDLGLTKGNKQRVICLAAELNKMTLDNTFPICIIDSDDDFLFDMLSFQRLIRTDYANMNAYMHQKDIFKRFLSKSLGIRESAIDVLYEDLFSALRFAFVLRAVKRGLVSNGEWAKFEKICSIDKDHLKYEKQKAINRFLSNEKLLSRKDEIVNLIEDYLDRVSQLDPLVTYNSHDFDDLLSLIINTMTTGIRLSEGKVRSRLLMSALRKEDIEDKILFLKIESLISSSLRI